MAQITASTPLPKSPTPLQDLMSVLKNRCLLNPSRRVDNNNNTKPICKLDLCQIIIYILLNSVECVLFSVMVDVAGR